MDKNNKKGSVEVNIGSNFIHDIIDRHLRKEYDRVHRFPPEPNGISI